MRFSSLNPAETPASRGLRYRLSTDTGQKRESALPTYF